MATATFGAGCFWGVEETFRRLPGVLEATSGYMGGSVENPTYQQVCTGRTGHAEVVEVQYDPSQTTYARLLEAFFQLHDPTTPNRQGPDVGSQYRSAVFTYDDDQAREAAEFKRRLDEAGSFRRPIVTEIAPAGPFWRAEEYHQRYVQKHGGASCHI
ncbi:peptide-methionine (S)-S-oxide reductase MsrA [Paludisphaera mucosa]|uniref:Peptide methionine sulfoxide reductase MsrA n=1 Tax=Paludisphaera mucosa TaxID=3030827 RepID=A0ABT6FHI8_9BACT|nr:peptide-methionine (S)-S-oxide reductase MsrA [Paludisphaera mucosa]MDG3007053.1 peptide-methionine (S)-S-oxide reductase MsrA [Paludisphaera mucosa]